MWRARIVGRALASVGLGLAACGPSAVESIDGRPPPPDGTPACVEGAYRCDGNDLLVCHEELYQFAQTCAQVCNATLGCVACAPGTGTCDGDTSHVCKPDGSGHVDMLCDPAQGVYCQGGVCTGECAPQNLGTSYIGCEYYPTVTGNEVGDGFSFAVAVSNTTSDVAHVSVDGGALSSAVTFDVAAGSVHVQKLPWVGLLKACSNGGSDAECGLAQEQGALVRRGAYRLRSTKPVTVYQFNPLEYVLPGGSAYSVTNDASLLLPANALTGSYHVLTWPAWYHDYYGVYLPALMAITATRDDTTITITTTAATQADNGAPAFTPGAPRQVTLDQGDVLELMNFGGDLTGSTVVADRPVQVIAGHYCTQVPFGNTACDHLEESMFPYETLAYDYLVTSPATPAMTGGRTTIVRIMATEAGTALTYDPPQGGAPAMLGAAGDVAELTVRGDFLVSANHKILVAQFMVGQDYDFNGSGDPAMALAVTSEQFRTSYLFHAPTNYDTNYVNVVAPAGATITLDGAALSGFTPIGSSGFGVLRTQLGAGTGGNHSISGDQAFGISVYGYGSYTSYWYPGGLDLDNIPVD